VIVLAFLLGFAAIAAAQNPYTAKHPSWISLAGRIDSVGEDAFRLDSDAGALQVELEGWGWLESALPLRHGERVIVHGRIDEELFEERRLRADAIYLPEQDAHYYAGDTSDLSGHLAFPFLRTGEEANWVTVTGTVERVGRSRFSLDAGGAELVVETNRLRAPIADRLAPGDRVSVHAEPARGLFEKRRLRAASVAKLGGQASEEAPSRGNLPP
jgi:hypothetical protein